MGMWTRDTAWSGVKGTDSPILFRGQVAQEEGVVPGPAGALARPDKACSPKPVVASSHESGGILCGRTRPICGLVLWTFHQTGKARNSVVQRLETWAVESGGCEGLQSQHCLL